MKASVTSVLSNTSQTGYPLSSVQRDVWLDQMAHPNVPFYNIGGYLRIDGHVDPVVFEKALRRVIKKNDAFRIVLHNGNPLPVQEFRGDGDFEIPFIDFSNEESPMQKAEAWMHEQFVRPFDLYGHFLFRYALLKVSDTCYCYFNNQHHLMADGLSILILTEHIALEYNAIVQGETSTYQPPSYLDFVLEEQKFSESKRFEQARHFWQKTFETLPESLIHNRYGEIDLDVPFQGGLASLRIKPEAYAPLVGFCKAQEVTPYHLLLAALYVCFLYDGQQEDFVYGAPVLNRSNARAKKTVGLFTSVSPVRFNFGLDVSAVDLLKQINGELKRIYRYQRMPLREINQLCGVSREYGRRLFDIGVSYEKNDYGMTFNGARAQAITFSNGFERNALSVALKEYRKGDDIELDFSYNLQAFDAREIDYLKERVFFVMQQMVRFPNTPVKQLDILPAQEKKDVLTVCNETQSEIPDVLAHGLFEQRALEMPDQVAAVYGEQTLTYGALNEQANQLALYLMAQGVGPQTIVGICLDRSFHMLVAILGVLKAGAAYLPLDPVYPQSRITFMMADASVQWVVTEEALADLFLEKACDVLCLDCDVDDWRGQSAQMPVVQDRNADALAYVIYTSGSTGKPKGVLVNHRSLVNLIFAQVKVFEISSRSRVLQFASFGFDASVSEIFTTLSTGATLVLGSKDEMMPGPGLALTLTAFDVTHVTLPPSSLAVLPQSDFPALETLVVAGEVCTEDLVDTWAIGRRFINAYGPTEATVCATAYVYDGQGGKPTIGQPIDNVQLYVLNEDLSLVPMGRTGELYIGGAGVAQGYLNRPDLTLEKFVPNPFFEGTQMYKTGDLVRWRGDGQLAFLGRKDYQVKIRGFRIELEEIESVLRQHEWVQDVIVNALELGELGRQLVAYIIPVQNQNVDVSILQVFLKDKLPQYMVPHFMMLVDDFPHTSSGKVDRKGFPAPNSAIKSGTQDTAPKTEIEKRLFAVWSRVMPNMPIGVCDSFFDMGLDSLQAIQFVYQVESEFDVKIHPSVLFKQNTILALGHYLTDLTSEDETPCLVEIQARESEIPFFCVTGGYGDVLVFKDLARFMPRSFYALQPPQLDGRDIDFQELVQMYLRAIRSVQKEGPFLLGGYSLGGLLALEMARELKRVGEDVDALVVFGAPLQHGFLGHWIYQRLMSVIKRYVPEAKQGQSEVLRILSGLFRDDGLQIHMNSLADYELKPYPGQVTIFEGAKASSRFYPWKRKWQLIALEGLEVVMLPGNHHSFMRPPYSETLAQQLEDCFRRASGNVLTEGA